MQLIFHKLPVVTGNLVIRHLDAKDLEPFLEFMLDPQSTQYLAFTDEQKTEKGAKELFDMVLQSYDSENPIESYAVSLKETGEYIGSIGLSPYDEGVYECYYCINSGHRNRGYAVEAMKQIFSLIDPHIAIRAHCSPENQASIRVAEKLGMTHLGEVEHIHSKLKGPAFQLQR